MVVVAAVESRRIGGAAELPAPDDKRVLEEAAALQVGEQPAHSRVDGRAGFGKLLPDERVVVPSRGRGDFDEPHSGLDEATGEKALPGEQIVAFPDAVKGEASATSRPPSGSFSDSQPEAGGFGLALCHRFRVNLSETAPIRIRSMKPAPLAPSASGRLLAPILLVCLLVLPLRVATAITLTGANGRAVEFHSLKTATEKGITAQMVADGPVIGITWDKLDLEALAREHPVIHEAYLRARNGVVVELDLDSKPAPAPGANAPAPKYPGWTDVKNGDLTFLLQLPGAAPRGILLVSMGDFGRSYEMVGGHERGRGPWGEFQNKLHLALLAYDLDYDKRKEDPTKPEDFIFATKGSGRVFEAAIKDLAAKAGKPELADLPIAVYGSGRSGAAFAYNFVQHCPGRILAATVSKGAFYDAEPTAESAKVPMLFVWGQYCNNHELLLSQNYAQTVLAKAAPLLPNWTSAREFRGRGEPSLEADHVARKYLLEMVERRLPAESPPPPPPAAEEGAEGAEEQTPATPSGPPSLPELDRSKGLVGNLESGEALKIVDPGAPLAENETFLPNETVARLWKAFLLGELEVPPPQPD